MATIVAALIYLADLASNFFTFVGETLQWIYPAAGQIVSEWVREPPDQESDQRNERNGEGQ